MDFDENDELVAVLPIHYSAALAPNVHMHQFPLLLRPLETPPSAILSGKRISARIKPNVGRLEILVPADTRPEVWSVEKSRDFGSARAEDDHEKNQAIQSKGGEDEEPRLSEVRLRSENIPQKGTHMLGVVRNGKLHLHPISETHQLRPTLTYLDILSKKTRRSRGTGSGSDSDDGPPPDPDEPAPLNTIKKEKKAVGEAKEVHVSARKTDDKAGVSAQGGLSAVRREMLQIIRAEEDEAWDTLEFCDLNTQSSGDAFEGIFSQSNEILRCQTNITAFLKEIRGL